MNAKNTSPAPCKKKGVPAGESGNARAQVSKQDCSDRPPNDATQIVELAIAADELWFDPVKETSYVSVQVDCHIEHMLVDCRSYKESLELRFYQMHARIPGPQATSSAIATLTALARIEGPKYEARLRTAGDDDRVLVDLADSQRQVIEIDATGFRRVTSSTVKFDRRQGMQPLPVPTAGDAQALRQLINVTDEDFALLLAWLIACFRPSGPYPVLVLAGEQGSAKSTTAKMLRSLVDPNRSPIRAMPDGLRDLAVAAANNHVLVFDNLSKISVQQSDALCRLATGGGFAVRELYANDRETIFEAQRPIILTGIENVVERPDLADRSIAITLPVIPAAKRTSEKALWREFERERPAILGAIFALVAAAIKNLPLVKLADPPRMIDFAEWATAAEVAMGLAAGEWITIYRANIAATNVGLFDDQPILSALKALLSHSPIVASAQQWLDSLNAAVGDSVRRQRSWPKTAKKLSGELRRLAPVMRRAGILIDFDTQSTKHRARIAICLANDSDETEMQLCSVRSVGSVEPRQLFIDDLDEPEVNGGGRYE